MAYKVSDGDGGIDSQHSPCEVGAPGDNDRGDDSGAAYVAWQGLLQSAEANSLDMQSRLLAIITVTIQVTVILQIEMPMTFPRFSSAKRILLWSRPGIYDNNR